MPSKKAPTRNRTAHYAKMQKNFCFACGPDNHDGMQLKFSVNQDKTGYICRFQLGNRYVGPPGHCHGGIIATILDDAMGKVNRLRDVVALTSQITVNYLKPVPLHKPLRVESWEIAVHGRRHRNAAAIKNAKGETLASSEGTFIAIDPEKMFKKHIKK